MGGWGCEVQVRVQKSLFRTSHFINSLSNEKGKSGFETIAYYPVHLSFCQWSEFSLRQKSTMSFVCVRFVQFFMRLGCGKGVPDPRSQPVLLQYSLNGGLSWSLLQEFLFSNSSNVGRYIALEIPLKARSASTRLRWWQPSENGHFYSPWVIDQVSPFRHHSLQCCHLS